MKKSAIAAMAALTLLLTGCTAFGNSESARQAVAFPEIYDQKIAWGECNDEFAISESVLIRLAELGTSVDDFACGMVTVPLDWNDADNTETIKLATLHIPSTGSDAPLGTLLSNPGGPGHGGISLAYGLTVVPAFAEILENYDILGFDPRGMGRSTPLGCEAVSSIRELNLANCAEEEPLAATMGTSQVARDMELLRSLMGDNELNYLGYSYGTMLGATYATLFPERLGRVVLDSAAPSDWASPTGAFNQQVAVVRQTVALLEGCDTLYQVSTCPLVGEDDLLATYLALNEVPLMATDGSEVTGDSIYGYLITSLYQRAEVRSLVLETLGAALAGEQSKINDIATAMEDGGASVQLDGTVVSCHSFPEDPHLLELVEHIEDVGIPVMLGGPEINDETLEQFIDLTCDALPHSGDDITDSFSGSADAPILVIGITDDHATPYEGSQSLVEELGNATLLTLDGTGHGASYGNRSTCIDDYTTAFLIEGTMPPAGTVCLDD